LNNLSFRHVQLIITCLAAIVLQACSSQRDGSSGKGIQNLTARYNYIYNANILLNNYVSELNSSFADNYNDILPVYISPEKYNPAIIQTGNNDNVLDEIINKSKTIITDKSLSNYVDDAYLLMGKSQFYKGSFFLAAEYFGYISKAYQKDKDPTTEALNWQARSYIQLQDLKLAAKTLDQLEKQLDSTKKNRDEAYATLAQMALELKQPKSAVTYLLSALKESRNRQNAVRWHFILGQLFEQQQDYQQAIYHYKKVQSSNTGFELYFNAKLKQVKLDALAKGAKLNHEQQLLGLLKDEKNLDFSDQIYFQIADYFLTQQNIPKALQYYNASLNSGHKNNRLKGLTYLQLAEINFQHLKNYLQAKQYYDSTLLNLPKTYTTYNLILKKSQSLEYLSSRYKLIAEQDTLQALAKLPATERASRIRGFLFTKADTVAEHPAASQPLNRNGAFYFNNTYAMERGAADFLKRWGNRKLEDNWRQSIRTNASNTQQTLGIDPNTSSSNDILSTQSSIDSNALASFLQAIPLTPQMLEASNQKIINAWYELGNFYQQELNDTAEAARIYEYLLNNFPENNQLAAINYSLFLIYRDNDPSKAETFKSKILRDHSSSIYARTLLDPNFSIQKSAKDTETGDLYTELFNQYAQKKFSQVIEGARQQLSNNQENQFAAQFAYLKAIAVGRTQSVDSLLQEFKQIKLKYPADQLIVPLVDDHLRYINAHLAAFKRRKIALVDFDPNEPRFIAQQPLQAQQTTLPKPALVPAPVIQQTPAVKSSMPKVAAQGPPAAAVTPDSPSPFSNTASASWYFVIDVSDATIRLTSSRFGLGQFNRGNYPGTDLRHQLIEFDNEQLIYVGNFSSFEAVKTYQDRIVPQLNRIMRVRPGIYKSFVISKENFELIKNKASLDQYLQFYNNNY
jgi:tetratricopeptide (TPR) repeat protein